MTIKTLTEAEIREEKLVLVREVRRLQGDMNDVLGNLAQAGIIVSVRYHDHTKIGMSVSQIALEIECMERL